MKQCRKTLVLLLAALMILSAVPALAEDVKTVDVKKITIETKPDKTAYMIGEEFDPAGGVLEVTYKDKSTAIVPMTNENVTFSGTNLSSEGKKSVTIEFGGKSVRLSVTVSGAGYQVIFDENYEGGAQTAVSVAGGAVVSAPDTVRAGYTLLGWYTDPDFREAFAFDQGVKQDWTLYACWLADDAQPVTITFDYDYYGDPLTSYTRVAAAGESIPQPADPARLGYAFDHWALNGEDYDFSAPVTEDITLTACWTKTVTQAQTYVFEAEDTDLTGKVGVGSSGASTETAMIQFDAADAYGASNSRWVGYLYKPNLSLDFYIASDVDVSDASIALRVGNELPGEFTYAPDSYTVLINGVPLDFTPFSLAASTGDFGVREITFETVLLAENVALKAGENVIQIYPSNNTTISGTTYQAVSPLVDSLEITTSAVLIWDATKGLPAKNY